MVSVWVFFYGSYIDREVLSEVDLAPEVWEPATLAGFDLRVRPRANLVRDPASVVFGILTRATHAELDRLYREHAFEKLGETYLPEAVLAIDAQGRARPALCYLCPSMTDRPAEAAYVERIAGPAERYGFPAEYVAKIRGFAP